VIDGLPCTCDKDGSAFRSLVPPPRIENPARADDPLPCAGVRLGDRLAARNDFWFRYLRCWEGLVFLAFVLDAYSRMIVGWQLASHMRTDLLLDALRMALHRRGPRRRRGVDPPQR
jgi:transposase InsO family protein